ncbi:MAG: ATP-binding protein [bacterium]
MESDSIIAKIVDFSTDFGKIQLELCEEAAMIDRIIEKKIDELREKFPVIMVTGPRQSGKTTLAKKCFPNHRYVNLENLDERAYAQNDPRKFLELKGNTGIVIDEVQRVPELFSYIQGFVDESGKMGEIILTGSQNFLLMESVTQSLAGRVAILNLLPFSLNELEHFANNNGTDWFLFTGMYPPVYDRGIAPYDFFANYFSTYVERDVRLIKNIGDLNAFRRFVSLCAGRAGQLLNMSSLANETGIDAKTAKAWISVLENSHILFLLQPYFRNFNKRTVKQPKLYFYDTGLLSYLLGIRSPEQLAQFYMRGSLFENFIISETVKHFANKGKKADIYFWRDSSGNEVDLIVDYGTEFSSIEIKSSHTFIDQFANSLKKFSKISGSKGKSAIVYGGDFDQERSDFSLVSWRKIHNFLK